MKTILFMAMAANGIIARENNDEDFISDENWKIFVELTQKAGCVIWGRKTFEVVQEWDKSYLDQLEGVKKVIVSRQKLELPNDYILASSPNQALEMLEKSGFKEVILCGGSANNTSFAKENLIDEIIFNIEPIVVGKGIPVFIPQEFDLKLSLKTIDKVSENIAQVHYTVNR